MTEHRSKLDAEQGRICDVASLGGYGLVEMADSMDLQAQNKTPHLSAPRLGTDEHLPTCGHCAVEASLNHPHRGNPQTALFDEQI